MKITDVINKCRSRAEFSRRLVAGQHKDRYVLGAGKAYDECADMLVVELRKGGNLMSCRMNIEVDILDWLEAGTMINPRFDFNDWASGDTDRLKKIVEFLEQQEEDYRCEPGK